MAIHPDAGKPVAKENLTNIAELVSLYYETQPDVTNPDQKVAFGTSGHRGTSLNTSFTEDHIMAISQAICEYREEQGITGPLFIGKDTHALSTPAEKTALQVFAANGVTVMIDRDGGYTPTPVISHAILAYNQGRTDGLADGVVITPSHNPPDAGGFKYNPPNGGPADTDVTKWIAGRANELLADDNDEVESLYYADALAADTTVAYDFITPYVADLGNVINMDAIAKSGLKICADAMGGAGLRYWKPIAEKYGIDLTIRNDTVDATFSFMTVDRDGKVRMDCSSPYAMASLVALKDEFDIAFGNDPDYDRHGIVTKSAGLMNPNHYLAVAINYLFTHRDGWRKDAAIGKTLVSSSMIDRVAGKLGRKLCEVPVGFKWFVDGLGEGSYGFGGEESAGASFLRKDGTVWTTDKDGIILCLLACEIYAVTGKDPGEHYQELVAKFGNPVYARIDAPANREEKAKLAALSPEQVKAETLAGEPITAKLTHAPANGAAIGGIKVCTENGWFAARPSGTEDIYKIYAESFKGEDHLKMIQAEAKEIVKAAAQGHARAKDHVVYMEYLEQRMDEPEAKRSLSQQVSRPSGNGGKDFSGDIRINEGDWRKLSPLTAMGYHVGRIAGVSESKRRDILMSILYGALCFPEGFSDEEREEWGEPGSVSRLQKIVTHIHQNIRLRRNLENMEDAVADWESDLEWLEQRF